MMKMAEKVKINQPFKECLDPKLESFQDAAYVKEVCTKFYGIDLCEECEKRENFCDKCCVHRVGIEFPRKQAQCKTQCTALIKETPLQQMEREEKEAKERIKKEEEERANRGKKDEKKPEFGDV